MPRGAIGWGELACFVVCGAGFVGDAGGRGGGEGRDACGHIAISSLVRLIRHITDSNSEHTGNSIDRDGEQLGLGGGVAHVFNNGWQEERESVEWHVAAHVDHHAQPHLVVAEGLLDGELSEALVLVRGLLVLAETADHADGAVERLAVLESPWCKGMMLCSVFAVHKRGITYSESVRNLALSGKSCTK